MAWTKGSAGAGFDDDLFTVDAEWELRQVDPRAGWDDDQLVRIAASLGER